MLPVLLGIIIIVFTLMYITPGDPARSILGDSASQEMVDELREEMGLNDSYFARLGTYLRNVVFHGDLGVSYKTGRPVLNEILARYSTTLTLTVASSVLAVVLGILMGRIRVEGAHVQTWLNGELMADLTDKKIGATQGRIALQIHDGGGIKVQWRNIRLTRL